MENYKYIQQLINTHKLSYIILPLMEAVEINKRSGEIKNLKTKDLLKQVIEVGGELYNKLLDKNLDILDSGLISDKLFLSLSSALRNNIVLYNNTSLSLIKDDLMDVFIDNLHFIQTYQNEHTDIVNNLKEKHTRQVHDVVSYVMSSIVDVFTPIWLFHANLYTSGFINTNKLTHLNKTVSNHIISLIKRMVKHTSKSQGDTDVYFKADSLKICSKVVSQSLFNYQSKIIKKKKDIEGYIKDPIGYIERLTPVVYSNYSSLNKEVLNLIKEFIT